MDRPADQSTAYQLALIPKRLARDSAEDLAHVHLDVDLTGMVPYY
ncbi:hypothetical protein AB0G86_05970 [Streptomyces scabiei]